VETSLEIAANLCRRFEGFSAKPYLCPAGYWTIGYGTVYKPDKTVVTPYDPVITQETAEEWLQHELRHNYLAGVLHASPHLARYPEVLGAITDFAYNLGVGRYRASTLKRRINAEDWESAGKELMRWTRGGGKILRGLVLRRHAELKYINNHVM
jgi:lysozyme